MALTARFLPICSTNCCCPLGMQVLVTLWHTTLMPKVDQPSLGCGEWGRKDLPHSRWGTPGAVRGMGNQTQPSLSCVSSIPCILPHEWHWDPPSKRGIEIWGISTSSREDADPSSPLQERWCLSAPHCHGSSPFVMGPFKEGVENVPLLICLSLPSTCDVHQHLPSWMATPTGLQCPAPHGGHTSKVHHKEAKSLWVHPHKHSAILFKFLSLFLLHCDGTLRELTNDGTPALQLASAMQACYRNVLLILESQLADPYPTTMVLITYWKNSINSL